MDKIALTSVRVFDGERLREPATVVIRMLAFSAPLKPVDMMSGHISTCSSASPSGTGARLAIASGTRTYSA